MPKAKVFLSTQWDRDRAQKRGGGQSLISLDFETADSNLKIEPESGLTPDQIFERQWIITLLGQILQRLRAEFEMAGKGQHFEELKEFVIGDSSRSYGEVSEKLNMSEAAARKAASRMRTRYRELLRDEIAQTVNNADEVDEEIRNLFQSLGEMNCYY